VASTRRLSTERKSNDWVKASGMERRGVHLRGKGAPAVTIVCLIANGQTCGVCAYPMDD
jgi:hypothetical protein